MERLTKRDKYGISRLNDNSYDGRIAAYHRLALYEDTGLVPEDCKAHLWALDDLVCTVGYDRLRELAAADKDGRVVVLPRKVGDTVYSTTYGEVQEMEVESYNVFDGKAYMNIRGSEGFLWTVTFASVFLTREEAKKALEAMRDADD